MMPPVRLAGDIATSGPPPSRARIFIIWLAALGSVALAPLCLLLVWLASRDVNARNVLETHWPGLAGAVAAGLLVDENPS